MKDSISISISISMQLQFAKAKRKEKRKRKRKAKEMSTMPVMRNVRLYNIPFYYCALNGVGYGHNLKELYFIIITIFIY